jgi:UDP-N-acetylmuramate dehydrogenase
VNLAELTTLGLGGPARRFVRAATEADLIEAVRAADASGEPLLILGGGSNLVVADQGFDGTVVQVATAGLRREGAGLVTVAAGEDWDTVVAWTVAEGLAGLECLSGVPGRAGATPIQNVGAYGQEVAETITEVRTYDRVTGQTTMIPNDRCGFGYRTSVFKRDEARRHVVLAVTFRLAEQSASTPLRYPELAAALGVAPGDQAASTEVRSAVIELRRSKGMVIDAADPDARSVGSFFVNPVLDAPALAAVEAAARARYGDGTRVPRFDAGDGLVKVPAAWLIERAGFGKGYNLGDGARISSKHTLALVNSGSATTASLLALARRIRDGVHDTFGVSLTPEPVLVGVTL